jgi:hypothetical protein
VNRELSVITLGHVHTDAIESLTRHCSRLEQVVVDLPPRVAFVERRPELNRAIDAARSDWILILREREFVDDALAAEIAGVANAWGFRIRVTPVYAGKPLRLGDPAGEVRLLHRRHLLRRGELTVEGTVVRLGNPIRALTFASPKEHRAYLESRAVPHSALRRVLLFLRNARTLDTGTLRYLWIEAGFDQS